MNAETGIISNLKVETEEAVLLIRYAEEILKSSKDEKLRIAAEFLHRSSHLVEKHKKHKIDRLKAI